jgi:hypothetical protein
MELPKIRDDITQREILLFVGLLAFLAVWVWVAFFSGWLY